MRLLKVIGWILGFAWSSLHTLFGLLLLCTVYFPKSISWSRGAVIVIVRWSLIPKGFKGNLAFDDDNKFDFETGAQTHGIFIFVKDEMQAQRADLIYHERIHVYQGMVLGPFYPPLYGLSYVINLLRGMLPQDAYLNIWFEKHAYAKQAEFNAERRRDDVPIQRRDHR